MELANTTRRLEQYASNYVANRGYKFGEGVEHWIPHIAEQAARRIEADRGSTEKAIKEAERAFARLIDEMIAAANRIPGYNLRRPNTIGEETRDQAMLVLCPIWPIC